MSRITRRATLAMFSLLVCATLIAVGPRAALPATPTNPEYTSLLHTDSLLGPFEAPVLAYVEPAPRVAEGNVPAQRKVHD